MPRVSGFGNRMKNVMGNNPVAVYSVMLVVFLVIYFVFPRTVTKNQKIHVPVKSSHNKMFNALSDIDKVGVRRILEEFEDRNLYSYAANVTGSDNLKSSYGGYVNRRTTIDLVKWYDNVFDIAIAIKNAEECKLSSSGAASTGSLGEVSGAANKDSYDTCVTNFLRVADLYSNFAYNFWTTNISSTTDLIKIQNFNINDWTLFDFDMKKVQRSLPTYTTHYGKIYSGMTFVDTTGISVSNDYDVIDWAEAEKECNKNPDAIGYVFAAIYPFMEVTTSTNTKPVTITTGGYLKGIPASSGIPDLTDDMKYTAASGSGASLVQEKIVKKPRIFLIKSIPSKLVFDTTMTNMVMCLKK